MCNLISIFVLSLLINCVFNTNLYSQDYNEVSLRFKPVVEMISAASYKSALEQLHTLKKNYSKHPFYYLVFASYYQTMMMDYEDYRDEKIFFSYLDSCLLSLDEKEVIDSAEYYYYKGTVLGYKAAHLGKKKEYLKALNIGRNSIKDFEKCVGIDSHFYDAYLGLGMYHYWMSAKLKYLAFLPYLKDNRELGIKQLWLAAKNSQLMNDAALNLLAWAYLNEKEIEKSISITRKLIKKYPESRTFYWTLLEIGKKKKDVLLMEQALLKILELIRKDTRANDYNELVCIRELLNIYKKEQRIEDFQCLYEYFLTITINEDSRNKVKAIYEEISKLNQS